MTTTKISRNDLYSAMVEFEKLVDSTQNHIHLRMHNDGTFTVDQGPGYEIGTDEFNGKPGSSRTLKHKQGNGQCNLPEDWSDDDGELWDAVDQLILEQHLEAD